MQVPLRDWGSCIWGVRGQGPYHIFRVYFVSHWHFNPYIEFRETHKTLLSFLDGHSGSLQPCRPRGEGCAYGGFNWNPIIWIHWKFWSQNVWYTAYLIPKNMGNNFHIKIGQHFEAIPRGFLLSYFSQLNSRNLQLLKILPKNGKFMLQILDKKWLSR